MDHIVGGKFKLGRKIGGGSFGEIFLGQFFLFFFFFSLCYVIAILFKLMNIAYGFNLYRD